uniref:Uncharacterized protein n=1 Tax=Macrostomum lignano TaxID=282301 RepID=A0A1I8GP27_9PLAT
MSCNSFTSWEIQDNLKLRSVVTEKIVEKPAAEAQSANAAKENEIKLSEIGIPEHSVTLRPFLHPELTDASRDACELRLLCEPHLNLSIRRLTVVATARNTEFYDRKGEYIQTVRGLNIPGTDWYRFLYCSAEPCYEVKLKPGSLLLGNVEVHLESHTWPAQLADAAAAQSVPSLLERLSEVELSPHARSVLNLLCAANQQQQQQQQQQLNYRQGAVMNLQQQQQTAS